MAGDDGRIEVPAPKGPLSADQMLGLLIQSANTFKATGNAPWAEADVTVNGHMVKVRVTVS